MPPIARAVELNEKSMMRCDWHWWGSRYGPHVASINRIGVIGAGQLGQMMVAAAIPLDLTLHFLSEDAQDPAAQVSPHHHMGSALSMAAVKGFAEQVDVITCEHELIDLEILEAVNSGSTLVYPSAHTLAQVVDKAAMRSAVDACGAPAPPWMLATNLSDLEAAVLRWPNLVAKAARGGYDGRGLCFIRDGRIEPDHAQWVNQITAGDRPDSAPVQVILEPLVDLTAELAVIVVRGTDGAMVIYDPVRTVQIDGQCRSVLSPHGLSEVVDTTARQIASQIAEHIGVVGVVAVEMFVVGETVLVNELAARPHNSGHHSIDACVTSQFENHLRAVAGLPLGSAAMSSPAAVMVNLIARDAHTDPRAMRELGLGVDPRVRLHLYAKTPRAQRKVGHVTVVADDVEEASALAWQAVRALGGDDREHEARAQLTRAQVTRDAGPEEGRR
jgi:5-(carboxyamino)imidazole ribonucleotide synthase